MVVPVKWCQSPISTALVAICLGVRESSDVRPTLALAEDVSANGQDCPRVVVEVLGDFVNGCSKAQPGRSGVVAEGVPSTRP